MATRKTCFRVESSRETGEVTLLIATACGFRPVMAWPDVVRLKEFAGMLMGVCGRIEKDGNASEIPKSFIKEFREEEWTVKPKEKGI